MYLQRNRRKKKAKKKERLNKHKPDVDDCTSRANRGKAKIHSFTANEFFKKDKRPQRVAAAAFRCAERVLDVLPLELRFDDGIW
jgi:hypothetical protein